MLPGGYSYLRGCPGFYFHLGADVLYSRESSIIHKPHVKNIKAPQKQPLWPNILVHSNLAEWH